MSNAAKPKRILLVDDDPGFREIVEATLKNHGFQVVTADDGRKAAHAAAADSYDIVLTDVQMPDVTGIHLMRFLAKAGRMPIVLMSGMASFRPKHHGPPGRYVGFIAKPFTSDSLLEVLKQALASAPAPSQGPDSYYRVSIEEISANKDARFDLFSATVEGEYVRLLKRGTELTQDRLRAIKGKGLRCLYLLREDYQRYVGFNPEIPDPVDQKLRQALLDQTASIVHEHLAFDGTDSAAQEAAQFTLENTISMLSEQPEFFKLLMTLKNHGDELYTHSLGVAFCSILIARQMKWNSPITLLKLTMGALFHDIGKKDYDLGFLRKPTKDHTPQESKAFKNYPGAGAKILQEVAAASSDSVCIVSQHHEDVTGTGFPLGLKKNRIHPLARLVKVADGFCEMTVKGFRPELMKSMEAIHHLWATQGETSDYAPLAALSILFSAIPPDESAIATRSKASGWK
jgi:putative nucleotidyltransferase with HDIG domain